MNALKENFQRLSSRKVFSSSSHLILKQNHVPSYFDIKLDTRTTQTLFYFLLLFKGLYHLQSSDLSNLLSWVIPVQLALLFHLSFTLGSCPRVPAYGPIVGSLLRAWVPLLWYDRHTGKVGTRTLR